METDEEATCLLSHLDTVRIDHFECTLQVLNMPYTDPPSVCHSTTTSVDPSLVLPPNRLCYPPPLGLIKASVEKPINYFSHPIMDRAGQQSRKRQKLSKGEQSTDPTRLSTLPDDAICRILSFLSIKLSVATSTLAKRWRFLWANVPNLDYDSRDPHSCMRFSSIIKNVILPHKMQTITSFSFHNSNLASVDDLNTWVTTAVERNVQNVYIDLKFVCWLPNCLFSCKTLVNLSLNNISGMPCNEEYVYLPILKKLSLCNINYETDGALLHLLAGCPVLEDLMFGKVIDGIRDCCYITLPTVERLTIDFPFDNNDNVNINAPALRYLTVYGCLYDHISLCPLTSLMEAEICFDIYTLQVDYLFYTRCVSRFIDNLCNVKYLKLKGGSAEFPHLGMDGPHVRFDNLIKLELTADWRFIPMFLKSADNLEVLIIHEVDLDLKIWMEPTDKQLPCLLSSLTSVTIYEFSCTSHEFGLVRYLLSNARVLKKMKICCLTQFIDIISALKSYALQRISLIERGSKDCEVALS